jgi:hemophore-related protein
MIMTFSETKKRRGICALTAGLLGGVVALVAAPGASAAPNCSAAGVANTISSVTGSAHDYLNNHPDANQAVTAAYTQPRPVAASNLRTYFTAHPAEYFDLRGILAPLGDTQRQCNVSALPPDLASAYDEFMAG